MNTKTLALNLSANIDGLVIGCVLVEDFGRFQQSAKAFKNCVGFEALHGSQPRQQLLGAPGSGRLDV